MPAVVSDSSVLISLAAVGQFPLLAGFFGQVLVPDAVWAEVTQGDVPRAGREESLQARADGWLCVQSPLDRALVQSLASELDLGEAEAIALAVELRPSLLLLDEREGRAYARSLGLPLTGTVGLLLRAKLTGRLPCLAPVLTELVETHGFRLSRPLLEEIVREAGEKL